MRPQKQFLMFTSILIVVIALGLALFYEYRQASKFQEEAGLIEDMNSELNEMSNDEKAIGLKVTTTDKKQLLEFREAIKGFRSDIPIAILRTYFDWLGPQGMLQVIEEDPFCHSLGHNIGKVIFEKTKDLGNAMAICMNRCSGGCYHGVFMEFFKDSALRAKSSEWSQFSQTTIHFTFEDVKEEMKGICERPEVARVIRSKGNCYHAVGHAVMFLEDYNTKKAIADCGLFEEAGKGVVYYCATGAYMEREIAFKENDSRISKTYPCDEVLDHPAACYRYKLRDVFGKNEFTNASTICKSLSGVQRTGCFHGLGFGFYKQVYENSAILLTLCDSEQLIDKKVCIEGAIGMLNVYNPIKALDACSVLDETLKEICQNAIKVSNFGMSRDFDEYYYVASQ